MCSLIKKKKNLTQMALDVKAEVIEPFEGAIAVWTRVHF